MPDLTNAPLSTVAPDLSGMAQPGSAASVPAPMPAPNQPAPPAESMTLAVAAPDVTDRSINPATAPAPPAGASAQPPAKHQVLLNMVQGLADGLSAFGTSLATHGKEGGAAEVQQLEAGRQQAKQSAAAAAQAQKNAELQNQLTTGEINRINSQNYILGSTWKDEVDKSHFAAQEAGLSVQQKAQDMFDTKGQVAPGWTVDPNTGQVFQPGSTPTQGAAPSSAPVSAKTPDVLLGVTPATGATPAGTPSAAPVSSIFNARQNMILDAAGQELKDAKGNDDTLVIAARQVLADPKSTPVQKKQAVLAVQNKAGLSADVVKNLTAKADLAAKQEAAAAGSSVSKLSTPEALAAPGAQAAIQAKIDDPNTDPNDIPRLRALIPQAAVAQFNAENIKQREARNAQIVSQGSPDEAGKLLANRSLTIEELKSRQVTPQFITSAIQAAQKIDPTYKAAEASGQARIAAAPANQQFFGNTDSLLVKGGTLDQLQNRANDLPNGKIPVFNKVTNLVSQASGKGATAAYAAAVLGVADDYAKVMGVGSDTAREQVMERLDRAQSPEQAAAVINQFRQQVASQREGRLGTNPYLRDMYPSPTATQAPVIPGVPPNAGHVYRDPKTKQVVGYSLNGVYVPLGSK